MILSLFKLNQHIKQAIALNFEESFWLKCEIGQCKTSNGNYYLELIEKELNGSIIAQSNAVIWKNVFSTILKKRNAIINEILSNDSLALFKVKVNFHEKYGLKLIIEDIDPSYTIGLIALERQRTIEKLKISGHFYANKSLSLPITLQNIAILSSNKAAGYIDFINHLNENIYEYDFNYKLFPIAVQGSNLEKSFLEQIKQIHQSTIKFDCIVIIRGGGSKLDLIGFDNFEICKAIITSNLPIITGIGHEIDKSISDLVAHTSVKTPTAAAHFLIDFNNHFEQSLLQMEQVIAHFFSIYFIDQKENLSTLKNKLVLIFQQKITLISTKIESYEQNLISVSYQKINLLQKDIQLLQQLLKAVHPNTILNKGYSITRNIHGKKITNEKEIKKGQTFQTYLQKGSIKSIRI